MPTFRCLLFLLLLYCNVRTRSRFRYRGESVSDRGEHVYDVAPCLEQRQRIVSRGREISGQDFGASFLRAAKAYPPSVEAFRRGDNPPTTVQKRNRWVVETGYRRVVAK